MRSAKAPTISAQVMAAKVAWKVTKLSSGITTPLLKVAPPSLAVTPDRNSLLKPPMNGLPAVNATL
jgi:hypothetical protein